MSVEMATKTTTNGLTFVKNVAWKVRFVISDYNVTLDNNTGTTLSLKCSFCFFSRCLKRFLLTRRFQQRVSIKFSANNYVGQISSASYDNNDTDKVASTFEVSIL